MPGEHPDDDLVSEHDEATPNPRAAANSSAVANSRAAAVTTNTPASVVLPLSYRVTPSGTIPAIASHLLPALRIEEVNGPVLDRYVLFHII
jgi:hypothetical protein